VPAPGPEHSGSQPSQVAAIASYALQSPRLGLTVIWRFIYCRVPQARERLVVLGDYLILHTAKKFRFMYSQKRNCGLSPNFHIHVSVSVLYTPKICPPVFLQQNMPTGRWNI
jgi:hypothetical protein